MLKKSVMRESIGRQHLQGQRDNSKDVHPKSVVYGTPGDFGSCTRSETAESGEDGTTTATSLSIENFKGCYHQPLSWSTSIVDDVPEASASPVVVELDAAGPPPSLPFNSKEPSF